MTYLKVLKIQNEKEKLTFTAVQGSFSFSF